MTPDSPQEELKKTSETIPTRLENEDDDGYDPWSDRCVEEPLFEPDPWN